MLNGDENSFLMHHKCEGTPEYGTPEVDRQLVVMMMVNRYTDGKVVVKTFMHHVHDY